MKIKVSELKQLVTEMANKILGENADFTASRRIQHLAEEASMNFEDVIVKELKLMHPDKMSPEVQKAYIEITNGMKSKISSVVNETLEKLQNFPRETETAD